MMHQRNVLLAVLLTILVPVTAVTQGNLTDPYVILSHYFKANGGLDRMRGERTQYFEGRLSVAGLKGTVKVWTQKPDLSRTEADLGALSMTQGNNGEIQWVLDSNGKLQRITNLDESAIKRREVKRRMAEYEYVNPLSDVFVVTFEGIEKVDNKDCYVIIIKNNINKDVYTSYINTDNFLLEKSVSIEAENSNDAFYGDYREVNGLMVAFLTKQVLHQTGQVEEVTIIEYISNPEIDSALFDPPQQTAKDYQFVQGNSAENIPFRFIENHLYIPVTVGCKERLWILDTGAGMSVISEEFANLLGLELQGDLKGKGAGGTVDIKLTTLPPFNLQGIQFKEQTVAVINMKQLNRVLGVEIGGILGYDFLSRFVTKINYAKELISFYDPDEFEYNGNGQRVDAHIKNSVFTVEATLDAEHSGMWLFDLGASTTSLDGVYALLNSFTERKGVEGIGQGAANAFPTKTVKCQSIQFAGFITENPEVGFPYGGTDTVFSADEIGVLGNSLFRNFVIYCDYANEQVIVEKGDDFNKEFPEDKSGLKLIRGEHGGFEVLFVAKGTPAAEAGFREGDILESINGIDVRYIDGLIAIRKMLKEEPGTEYEFVVSREGQEKRLNLKLANLF
jgi:hypothetical protein